MRKILVSLAILATAATAIPAAAQYQDRGRWDQRDDRRHDRDDRRWDDRRDDRRDHRWDDRRGPSRQAVGQLLRELNQVERRIHFSVQRRIISPREGVGLRREANRIRVRLQRSGRNGLSGREFAQLRQQVNRLEQRLRHERRDRDGRRG